MPQTIEFEGVDYEFPEDASDSEIASMLQGVSQGNGASEAGMGPSTAVSGEGAGSSDSGVVPKTLSALDQSRGATAASEDSSPAGVGSIQTPAKTPTLGEVLSAQGDTIVESARRVGSGIAEAATTAAAGLSRISEVTPPTMLGRVIAKQLTGEDPLQKGREFLGEVQRAARPSFGVDPTKDKELVSKVIAGATSLVPIIASGPAAPLTAAGLMGESTRQDAEAHGATEGQKAAAFAGGATLGVISEALLGIPALLRSAKAAGATDAVLKSITRQAVEQGLKNTVRESSQEAIEQVSNNLLANTIVGYDPERKTSSGVLEAAGLGAAVGGPVGALMQTAATLDARADASFEQLKQEAESVAAPEAPQTAVPETPVETTAAPEASILRKVVTGEPVTLFHGSKKAGLTTTHPNSSFTLSRELAQKFAGPEGVVYEGMAPVPETNPARWSAEELLNDVEAGKITEAEAEKRFLGRVSEIRPDAQVSVTAAPEIAAAERAPAQTPAPPVGQSNLTAAVEKNIADARMMAPDDPAGFLRKMADSSRKQGKEEAAANFEAAEAALQPRPVEPVPDVAPHLKTDTDVQAILDEQPAVPEAPTMKAPEIPAEAGAAGGTGGRRPPPPTAIGTTPRGDRNWLRIPAWFRRIGRGLFTEGARHVLGRTNNQVGIALGRATRRHVDVEQELFGQHERILRDAMRGIPNNRQEALWTEVSQHVRDVENGRPTTPLAPDAQRVLDAWHDVGRSTGDIARANRVMVWDANLGAYRPMGNISNYIPRMFSKEVETALRDPDGNSTLYNNLVQAVATHRGITPEAAVQELNSISGRFSSNDFHANMELARLEQLPEIFYEYDLRNLASRYLPAFSERMAQIIAYGQRLGPRAQPQRMNLWDIARREARGGDDATQQWLNAAEDQATGFKPKNDIERNARRLQAIGNATLLSDPTTTVVRNLISGLSVTAERFGVVRSLRALREAARAASGLDAREIGALRDDIGSFLGAEQLGDSALDNAIRGTQQAALTASGFSGSENFVRRHGALTASAFARDAANALSTSPTSRLAREALRYFRSLDINPEAIVAEGGNWRAGPETRRFIRSSVRESQGGYRFDQVPIWGGTTVGRFLYQYGRWGIQRAGDIFRNTIRPAIGETVEFRGQRMAHRNIMPLVRLGMLTIGLGETFAAIAAMLFGRDRRDASLAEIGEAFSEDEARAVGLMGERIINDVLMAGTLGLIGQPVDYFKALKDQTRLKNPLDPPSIAGVKTLTELATKAKDQGGTLTKRDLLDAAAGLARGPKNVTDVARNVADEKLYEAQNDQRTLRNAARRWAKTEGMDVASKITFDTVRKSLNAPVFESINDALLTGDSERAKQLRDEFVASKATVAEKKKAREAVASSVEGRHPFRAGPFTADKYRKQFTQWADKNLSAGDREQIQRVIETYDKASKDAGL